MIRVLASFLVAVMLSGCAHPPAIPPGEIGADPALARAVRHVLPMITVESLGDDGTLSGDIASVVLLPDERGLTAAHCVEDEAFTREEEGEARRVELTIDGATRVEATMTALGLIGSRARGISIAEQGDGAIHDEDWAVLNIAWEGDSEGEPVREFATPVEGERVYLIGYPSRYLPAGWSRDLPRPDRPTPEGGAWRHPAPTVIAGRLRRPVGTWGLVVELPGAGALRLSGLSGGGAFVRRADRLALIGLVTRSRWSPLDRLVALAPIPEAARRQLRMLE